MHRAISLGERRVIAEFEDLEQLLGPVRTRQGTDPIISSGIIEDYSPICLYQAIAL